MQQKNYRIRPASAGYAWISSGAVLLQNNLVRWNIAMFVYLSLFLIAIVLGLGNVFAILSPIFWSGFYLAGEASVHRQQWTPAILFEPLKTHARSLLILGAIMALINLTIALFFIDYLSSIMDLDALEVARQTVSKTGDKTALIEFFKDPKLLQQTMLAILVVLLVSLPFIIAGWFAPVLIIKKSYSPIQALLESFKACSANFLPFFIYGLLTLALFFIFLITYFIAIFFVGPLFLASYFTSYQDIWPDEKTELPVDDFVDEDDDTDSTLTV